MEKKSENIFLKLVYFLHRIQFFGTCLHIAWSVVIVGGALFMDYQYFILDLPFALVVIVEVLFAAVGVFLWFRLLKNPQEASAVWFYQAFYYFVPVIFCVIKLIFSDSLFDFSGDMFAGLEALGLFIAGLMVCGICVIGCVCFHVVRLVKKRRKTRFAKTGRKEEPSVGEDEQEGSTAYDDNTDKVYALSPWHRVLDVLNVLLFSAIILFVVIYLISFGVEEGKKAAYRIELSQNDAYRTQVLVDLIESDVYQNAVWGSGVREDGTVENHNEALFDEAEHEICWEAYTYSLYVEALGNDPQLAADGTEGVGISKASTEVLEQGRQSYMEFTKRFKPERGVEMLNQELHYDAKAETVSVSSELYCLDTVRDSMTNCNMVVVFDKNWKVTEIRCREEALNQYVPY